MNGDRTPINIFLAIDGSEHARAAVEIVCSLPLPGYSKDPRSQTEFCFDADQVSSGRIIPGIHFNIVAFRNFIKDINTQRINYCNLLNFFRGLN